MKNSNYSKESFCEMYGKYKDRLYRYALYKLCDPNLAEDAVSECVLAAWKDIDRLRSADAFGAWIFAILRNICAGQIHKLVTDRDNLVLNANTYNAEVPDVPDDSNSSSIYDLSSMTQQSIELAEALETLKEHERDIVLMSVIYGLSSKEISTITGLAPGAVRSKLSRSLTKMRSFLDAR